MFGYVKNYSWSAREDGGYDCSTTIVSVGEVLESLKVNYSPFNDLNNISKTFNYLKSFSKFKSNWRDNTYNKEEDEDNVAFDFFSAFYRYLNEENVYHLCLYC